MKGGRRMQPMDEIYQRYAMTVYKQTRVEYDTPENGYFTHLVMLSALPYVSMPAASSYTMHAKYSLSGSSKF